MGSTHLLRLKFSGPFIEDDESSADYDASTSQLVVRLTKVNPGEAFENLDDSEKLLDRSGQVESSQAPVVENGEAPAPKTEREILLEGQPLYLEMFLTAF